MGIKRFACLVLLILMGFVPAKAADAQSDGDVSLFLGLRITPELIDWFNQTAGPNDIATVTPDQLGLLAQITAGRKQLIVASAAEAEKLIPQITGQIDIIGYDLEHWPATPTDEQADPVAAIQRLRALADEYGLLLALGPDRRFALDSGVQMAPFVDQFILQTQRLQSDSDQLQAFAAPIITDLRQANPDIRIVIQIRTEGSIDDLLVLVESLGLDVDGIGVLHNPATLETAKSLAMALQGNILPTHEPLAPTATRFSPPTAQPGMPFWGIRMVPSLVDWFNQTAGTEDVAAVVPAQIDLLDQLTTGRKQVLFTSVAEAEAFVPSMADKIDIVGYNPEHWAATPTEEQEDLITAVQRMRALADEYDLTFSLGPDRSFAQTVGTQVAPYADQFALQAQRLQADAVQFQAFTDPLIQELRRANPDMDIILQVRTEGEMADLFALIDSLIEDVDGIAILYNPTGVDKLKELVTAVQTGVYQSVKEGEETAVTQPAPSPVPHQESTPVISTTPPPTAAPLPTPSPASTICLSPLTLVLLSGGLTTALGQRHRKRTPTSTSETRS